MFGGIGKDIKMAKAGHDTKITGDTWTKLCTRENVKGARKCTIKIG